MNSIILVPASILPTNPSTELEEPPGYGSLCTNNEDCQYLTGQLECFRGTCVCLEGYVPLGKYLCYDIRGQGIDFHRLVFHGIRRNFRCTNDGKYHSDLDDSIEKCHMFDR